MRMRSQIEYLWIRFLAENKGRFKSLNILDYNEIQRLKSYD